MPQRSAASLIWEILRSAGVRNVFGTPGTTEVPLIDIMPRYPEIAFIAAAQESAAIGMADGYARASGRPGIVLLHTSYGVCHSMGNLFNACEVGTPLLIMAGHRDSRHLFEEPTPLMDLTQVMRNLTKWSYQVRTAQELPRAIRRALKVATTLPTGPVFLAIPTDVLREKTDAEFASFEVDELAPKVTCDAEQVLRAARLLRSAARPVILAGNSVGQAGAVPQLAELAELIGAEVYTEWPCRWVNFPTNHPLYMGHMFGISQIQSVGQACDVLFVAGGKMFRELIQFPGSSPLPGSTRVIHMYPDPWEIGKNYPVDVGLPGDVKNALVLLASEVRNLADQQGRFSALERLKQVANRRKKAKEDTEQRLQQNWDAVPITTWRLLKEVAGVLSDDVVLVDESCVASTYMDKVFEFPRAGMFFSNIASLGWGLAASLGISLAMPEKSVVSIIGDGSALFGVQGLWSIGQQRAPVVTVICNNRSYAIVKGFLYSYGEEAVKTGITPGLDLGDVDFVSLAAAFGIKGQRVESPNEIRPALTAALRKREPALIEVLVDPKDTGYFLPRLP